MLPALVQELQSVGIDTTEMAKSYKASGKYYNVLRGASKSIFQQGSENELKERQKMELHKQTKKSKNKDQSMVMDDTEFFAYQRSLEVVPYKGGSKKLNAKIKHFNQLQSLKEQELNRQLQTPTLADEINRPSPDKHNNILEIYQKDILNQDNYRNRFFKLVKDRQKQNLMTFTMFGDY